MVTTYVTQQGDRRNVYPRACAHICCKVSWQRGRINAIRRQSDGINHKIFVWDLADSSHHADCKFVLTTFYPLASIASTSYLLYVRARAKV